MDKKLVDVWRWWWILAVVVFKLKGGHRTLPYNSVVDLAVVDFGSGGGFWQRWWILAAVMDLAVVDIGGGGFLRWLFGDGGLGLV